MDLDATQQHPDRVRWGILGTGMIAHRFAEAVTCSPLAELVAVGSRAIEPARAFTDQFAGVQPFAAYEALVSASDVDAVYVATPQSRHRDDAVLALGHGKHVLVEKPLAMSAAEGKTIAELAERHALIAMEGMWTYFNPLVVRLMTLYRSGALGQLRHLQANCGPLGVPADHRAFDPALGASFLRETLIYPLSVATAIQPGLLHPEMIYASSVNHPTSDVDTSTAVILVGSGALVQFGGGMVPDAPGAARSGLHLTFERGWVELHDIYSPREMSIGWVGGSVESDTVDAEAMGFGWEVDGVSSIIRGTKPIDQYAAIQRSIGNLRLLDRIAKIATTVSVA